MSVKVTFEVSIPALPNFLRLAGVEGDQETIDVAKLSDEDLIVIAEQWKTALLAHARKRRIDAENFLKHQYILQNQVSR